MAATLTRKPAYIAASVADLLSLWHGDPNLDGDDSHRMLGYWHPSLVIAVCELTNPANVAAVRSRFYPGLSKDETPTEACEMIASGYKDWKLRA